jgi:rRNA maturation protein Rpf1
MGMLTALDAPEHMLDEHELNFVTNIRKHGWFKMGVMGEGEIPNFAYTTGFWKTIGFPELITFSMKDSNAHQTFCNIFNDVQGGRQLKAGERIDDILNNLDIVLLPMDKRHYKCSHNQCFRPCYRCCGRCIYHNI